MWEHQQNAVKIHLRLVFACKGGGGVGSVERVLEGRCWHCALCRMRSPHVSRGCPIPWVSPDVFHLAKTHTPSRIHPSMLTLGGLHPSLEGRGQVVASLGVDGMKKVSTHRDSRVVNKLLTIDRVLSLFLSPE